MKEEFLKEDLLQYLWNIGDIDISNLVTTNGEPIQIIERGTLNHDAGPDFLDAKIKISDTLWAGNVEIHKYSSDWLKHKHQLDPAYDNVVLHVVYKADQKIYNSGNEEIPCLTLFDRMKPQRYINYKNLIYNAYWIPCQHQFPFINSFVKSMWYEKLLVERLQHKTAYYQELLTDYINDWESLLYIGIARYISPNINRSQMEDLARKTPLSILRKHRDNISHIEALLYGQSGLLSDINSEDIYITQLQKDYSFFKQKYQLTPMKKVNWKFSKTRPVGFPTIRIAQLAHFIHTNPSPFSNLIIDPKIKYTEQLQMIASSYWDTHYRFETTSAHRKKKLGKPTIDIILVNVIGPILFLYGINKDHQDSKDNAMKLLRSVAPEHNSIITKWKSLGVDPSSAYETQALIELKNNYCSPKKCLSCAIGNEIMKKE